ncbi:MAG: hypothetical protein RL736_1080 [Pseudomonadota bacterium]|jgi:hypothetical protein
MPNLLPYRDYSEHEVLNLYSCVNIANKGTLVAPLKSWKNDGSSVDNSKYGPVDLESTAPGALYNNAVNNNFGVVGRVETFAEYDQTPTPIGVLLKDIREFDENGEKLMFNSRKAAEMDVIIKDIQSVPILTRGVILVNDIDVTSRNQDGGGDPDIGDAAYAGDNGSFATDGITVVGKFLSRKDENGYCLIKISIP